MARSASLSETGWPRRCNSDCRCGAGFSNPIKVPRASSRMALTMFAADIVIWVSAGVTLGIAVLIATVFDRVFRGRVAREVADKAGITREAATRLRFIRRLIYAVIILIGL